jgi:type I restriction enzyme S subunit
MSHSRTVPKSWQWTTLGEIAKTSSGGTPRRSITEYFGGSIPWVKIGDLNDDVIAATEESITDAGVAESSATVLPAGTLLIAMYGSIGKLGVLGMAAATNQAICALQPTPSVSRDFLYWLLRARRAELLHAGFGGTQANISQTFLRKLPVALPPRAEQDRIVAAIEARIAELESGLQELGSTELALARFQKSVLAAAVTGRLTAPVETSQSGAELLDEILCERQSGRSLAEPEPPPDVELPTNWTWATVDQLASLTQYGSSTKTDKAPEGVPVLRMGNIWDGRLRLDDLKYLPADHAEFPKLLLDNGDVLFNRTNSPELVGKAAVFRGELDPCSFASYLIRVRLDRRYRPELLVYYLNSALGRGWVGSVVSQQVGQANVNGSKLKQLTVPVPPLEEQVTICEMAETALTVVEETRKTISDARARADQLRRATLEGAVSGIAVPRNPSAMLTSERFETAPITS